MTIKKTLETAAKKLTAKGISSARLDVEVILSYTLKRPREWLLAHWEHILKPAEQKAFYKLIARRIRHEPVAYLIGSKNFYGLNIKVSNKVLIPRPETEQLVDEVLGLATTAKGLKLTIVDIGTGSGAIALALAKSLPKAVIVALDTSPDAMKLAKNNSQALRLPISFIKSDLLAKVKKPILAGAILVVNLPYLDKADTDKFPIEIKRGLKFEPQSALYAKKRGTALYQKLFEQINNLKIQPYTLVAEIGSVNWRDFLKLAQKAFPEAQVAIKKDLARRPRILVIKF